MSTTYTTKAVVAILAIFTLLSSPAMGQNKEELQPNITISATYYSSYLASRINRQITPDASIWYAANLKWKSGLYLTWLEIHGVNDLDWSTDATDESQATLGYGWKAKGLDFKLETTLINIHPIEDWFNHDRLSFDLYASKSFEFEAWGHHTVIPEFRALWFADTQNIKGGVPIVIPSITDKWSKPFGLDYLTLQTKLAIAWDGGLYKNDPDGVFFQIESGFQWKISPKATLTLPGVKAFVPISNGINDGREDAVAAFFAGFIWRF